MVSVAIIDIIGLTYDGDTLSKRGLGGSESAVILLSKELARVGFDVTVFNNCIDKESKEGVFDGVKYVDHVRLDEPNDYKFDVVISSRTVVPFLHPELWKQFPHLNPQRYKQIKDNAKLRAVWMHDTFCTGDHLIEDMITHGDIHELFTLSDWHTTYISTCDHGRKRMPEVLKKHIFHTRNGAVVYNKDVNVAAKDPFLYVYNASVTKGMLPLVEKMWERIKQQIPQAKLKVIGGYYRFRENAAPDEQEKKWRELVADPKYAKLDVEFTGIIKQSEIADILTRASFFLFPGAFPETFGISTLESLIYNTPLITTRFGALEETAVAEACYHIDYPIEPNGLYPHINSELQEQKFIATVVAANNNRYLHQQKMYYCNIVKDICGWDGVALQWKQHIYKKLGKYMPMNEYRQVSQLNQRIHKVYGRRFYNYEENYLPRNAQQRILIVTPVYNSEKYIEKCIESVITQDYDNWKMVIIDDASTDKTYEIAKKYDTSKIAVYRNSNNFGAPFNHYAAITEHGKDDDIVILLDGDDSLVNDNQIFHFYNNLYDGTTEFTYGSCWSMIDNIPLIAQHYPEEVKRTKSYRKHKFNWNMPYTHLRTFKKYLFNAVKSRDLQDEDGNWFKAGGDGALFYKVIEAADPTKVKVVTDVVYNYNDINPLNDYKINGEEQTKTANKILGNEKPKEKVPVKTILIGIPTAKYIEPQTYKAIYDLEVPEGYKTTFQYFYGYNIDQVRNLIASWAEKYDYLFSVDSDISFAPDTLKKLIAHDKDIVSGLYIQRIPGTHTLEVYEKNAHGGVNNIPYQHIRNIPLVEIAGCGFGCVLVKSEVIRAIGYPYFVYHSALDHRQTISEDVDFCRKAREKGFKLYADTTILCEHHGSSSFKVADSVPDFSKTERLRDLGNMDLLPKTHVDYLKKMKGDGVEPLVVYDIGACVLHWTKVAKNIWNNSNFYAFEAMDSSEPIFQENNIPYHIGLLSDVDDKDIEFYQNDTHPGGNSYYRENEQFNSEVDKYFNESHIRHYKSITLDSVVALKDFPPPDMIKMDVQGAELDVLKGAKQTLKSVKHLILELQKVEYNKGAPLREEVIAYLDSIGFELKTPLFSNNGPDGDYHFVRKT